MGVAVCIWMWAGTAGNEPLVGCGAGAGCAELLSSPASRLLGIPLSAWGLIYFAVGAVPGVSRRARESTLLLSALSGVGAASSLWLIGLMMRLDQWCPLCLLVHAVNALMIAALITSLPSRHRSRNDGQLPGRRGWRWTFGSGVLAGGLVWFTLHGGGGGTLESPLSATELEALARSESGELLLVKGEGAEADLFIDPTCDECHRLLSMLDDLLGQGPPPITVRLHFFPLEPACNPAVPPGSTDVEDHRGSCRLSVYGRMIGYVAPAEFPAFRGLLTGDAVGSRLESARAWMEQRYGPEQDWPAALTEEADKQLQQDINLAIDLGISQVPTLIVSGRKYVGCPDRVETLATILAVEDAPGSGPSGPEFSHRSE